MFPAFGIFFGRPTPGHLAIYVQARYPDGTPIFNAGMGVKPIPTLIALLVLGTAIVIALGVWAY